MKLRGFTVGTVGALWLTQMIAPATAGGLFVPGDGTVSTGRAGASVAATDDGEAIGINPAALAKITGTYITIGVTAIAYMMKFTRSGTYDAQTPATSYDGTPYPTITNQAKPSTGFGRYQPIPMVALVSDLGGLVPKLHVGIGVYAPNAYPFRDMSNGYVFNQSTGAPPPTRYDIITQSAAVILPTVAASYRLLPNLDVGAKFSAGIATLQSTTAVWGLSGNYTEDVRQDGLFDVHAHDDFVPVWGLGATWRPTTTIEIGAAYTSEEDIHAKGTATAANGPGVAFGGQTPTIGPPPAGLAKCAEGGTATALKACIDLALPQTAQLGGRYRFLDAKGVERGDVELDLDWENWSADRATNYGVTVDAEAYVNGTPTIQLKPSIVAHGLQDTYGARLGGSYRIPAAANWVILRGGVAYDTASAKDYWERVDLDGSARTTLALGASYRMRRVQIDAGFSAVLEGTRTNPGTCNPTATNPGCDGTGAQTPPGSRNAPDPIDPQRAANQQLESPFNQGTFQSHYLLFSLGASTWF